MIIWGLPVLGCTLLLSALLLRRWPLVALAVVLGGSVAAIVLQLSPASALLVVFAVAAGLDICYMAATRTRKVRSWECPPGVRLGSAPYTLSRSS